MHASKAWLTLLVYTFRAVDVWLRGPSGQVDYADRDVAYGSCVGVVCGICVLDCLSRQVLDLRHSGRALASGLLRSGDAPSVVRVPGLRLDRAFYRRMG